MRTYKLVPLSGDCGTQLVDGYSAAREIAEEIAQRNQTEVIVSDSDGRELSAISNVHPKLDQEYRAGDLPSGSVVRHTTDTEYVVGRSGALMRWEQPIPGSDEWRVTYAGRLAPGEWMTPRERAEVDEATGALGNP